MSRIVQTNSAEETSRIASQVAEYAKPGDIFALYGDLASGKTTFVQAFGKRLQVRETVSSPTFTLINEYEGKLPIYHFDCYRLGGVDEFYAIGFEEYFYSDGISFIEWADKIEEVLPDYTIRIFFRHLFGDEENRELKFECPEKREGICQSLP